MGDRPLKRPFVQLLVPLAGIATFSKTPILFAFAMVRFRSTHRHTHTSDVWSYRGV